MSSGGHTGEVRDVPELDPRGGAGEAGQARDAGMGGGPLRRLRRTALFSRVEAPLVGFAIWAVLWALRWTIRFRTEGLEKLEPYWNDGRPVVLSFWHGRSIMLPFMFRQRIARGAGMWIMNSEHRDGEMITRALALFGVSSTRGSSSRGAIGGTLALARKLRTGADVALIPDGPRGPAMTAKPGAVELAATAGAPLCPLSFSASRCVRLGGWDRMMIPLPFSRVVCVVGEPVEVPRGRISREMRESLRVELERRLGDAARRADTAARAPHSFEARGRD